jgi:HK97 family phage major capsid protein
MIDNITELRKKASGLLAEARKVLDAWNADHPGEPVPAELAKQVDALLGKADEVKAQIALFDRIAQSESGLADPLEPKAAHLGWREAGPGEGEVKVDPLAWREEKVNGVRVRYYVPLAVDRKGYDAAFEAYLRKGFDNLGPTDRKTLQEAVDTAGGFFVSPDFQLAVIRKVATDATIRPNARVVTTSRDVAQWPRLVYTADDKYTSSVRMSWVGETPASSSVHRVTTPTIGLHSVEVGTAMASLPISLNLIEDSAFDVAGIASELMAEAFALGEDDAFINGDGVGKPRGLITSVAAGEIGFVISGAASALTGDGLIDLMTALPSQYERGAKWYASKATYGAIRKLKASGSQEYLWPVTSQVGGFGAAQPELLGFPIVKSDFMPAVAANAYPILFGDMRGYLVVDRVGLSLQRLDQPYAEQNLVVLLARKRVGGMVVEPWRIKAQKVSA